MKQLCILCIRFYQWAIAPVKRLLCGGKGTCRYDPSCSQYAIGALQQHGFFKGVTLAALRIMRCHPWGGYGLDRVPALAKWKHIFGLSLPDATWINHARTVKGSVLVNRKNRLVAEAETPAQTIDIALQGSRDFAGGTLFSIHPCDSATLETLQPHSISFESV